MPPAAMPHETAWRRLLWWPALITLAVTLLRLGGELLGGPERWFNRQSGGAGALIGIVWLIPVFGGYFALRLARAGQGPPSRGRALGMVLAGVGVVVALSLLGGQLSLSPLQQNFWFAAALCAGAALASRGWPALHRTLLAYGLLARVPVVLVMLVALYARWGTHYELGRPDMAPLEPLWLQWLAIGVLPQLAMWVPLTLLFGGLAGALALLLVRR